MHVMIRGAGRDTTVQIHSTVSVQQRVGVFTLLSSSKGRLLIIKVVLIFTTLSYNFNNTFPSSTNSV